MNARIIVLVLLAAGTSTASADYPLKRKSSFESDEIARNPFLPIGYSRQAVEPGVTVARQGMILSPDSFAVTSILLGRAPLAVINGRDYGVGNTFVFEGALIRVSAIRDGEVVLTYGMQSIKLPLRRRERATSPQAIPKKGLLSAPR